MKTLRILGLVSRLYPIARKLIEALDKSSDGGKRITPAEWRDIRRDLLDEAGKVLDEYAGGRVG